MIPAEKYKVLKWLDENKITILMISIIALGTLPPFLASEDRHMDLVMSLIILSVLVSCFMIIRKNRITRYVSILTLVLLIVNLYFQSYFLEALSQLGLSALIIHAFSLVIRSSMTAKGTRGNMILVSITGYLIIGLLGGFLAEGLEQSVPGSYHHSTGMELSLYSFIYYSYVTMTTLGYGDIIPVTQKSQSLSLLLVVAGQLYLAVIIAINISKFMQKKSAN